MVCCRINGDYDDWYNGSKLNHEGITAAYSGLYSTLLSSTGNYMMVHGIEIILRPDVQLVSQLLPTIQRTAEACKLDSEVCQSSHILLEHRGFDGGINSPDGSNSDTGEQVIQSIGVDPIFPANSSADGTTKPRRTRVNDEWDCIDIQVCVSRQLKHRVLLCQFLKKLSPFLAPPTIPTGDGGEKWSPANPESVLNSSVHPQHNIVSQKKPHTAHFFKILKRMFTLSGLSLSCLYSIPVPAVDLEEETPTKDTDLDENPSVPKQFAEVSLDYQYVTQLEGMFREEMWKHLRETGKLLEDSFKKCELECANILTAFQAMYK